MADHLTLVLWRQRLDGLHGSKTEAVLARLSTPLGKLEPAARGALVASAAQWGTGLNKSFRVSRIPDPTVADAPRTGLSAVAAALVQAVKALPPEYQREVVRHIR